MSTARSVLARAGVLLGLALGACAAPRPPVELVLRRVHVVDLVAGEVRRDQAVLVAEERIVAVVPEESFVPVAGAAEFDGQGGHLIPGLWDMHVHCHRDRRAELQYPLYVAHGVTGVRELGTHLASALAARASPPDPLAPRVDWCSPTLDGVPPVLSHGLGVEHAAAARELVALLDAQGFDTLKVYDRLTREAYFALAEEAERRGLRLVGHVPLAVTPLEAAHAGQDSIEHLTLVLEACIPGALEWTAADPQADSMGLLTDGRLSSALGSFDEARARALFEVLRAEQVWQTPTLVQMRGAFWMDELARREEPRLAWLPRTTVEEWRAAAHAAKPDELAAGKAVFARQKRLVGELHRAGVGLLAGTDTSDEPWIFAGASLHEELELFVEAGLTPLEALRTATVNPARYRGDLGREGVIAAGASADLVLLDADPTHTLAPLARPRAVVLRGRLLDRAALDALLAEAAARAAAR